MPVLSYDRDLRPKPKALPKVVVKEKGFMLRSGKAYLCMFRRIIMSSRRLRRKTTRRFLPGPTAYVQNPLPMEVFAIRQKTRHNNVVPYRSVLSCGNQDYIFKDFTPTYIKLIKPCIIILLYIITLLYVICINLSFLLHNSR